MQNQREATILVGLGSVYERVMGSETKEIEGSKVWEKTKNGRVMEAAAFRRWASIIDLVGYCI